MTTTKKLVSAAKIEAAMFELPAEEFNRLLDRVDVRIEAAWGEEIRRRIAEVESGEVVPIPYEEARAGWRALLAAPGQSSEAGTRPGTETEI